MSEVPLSLGNWGSEAWNWSSAASGIYTVNVLFSNAYITLSRIQIHKSLIQQLLKATFQHFRTCCQNCSQSPLLPSAGGMAFLLLNLTRIFRSLLPCRSPLALRFFQGKICPTKTKICLVFLRIAKENPSILYNSVKTEQTDGQFLHLDF